MSTARVGETELHRRLKWAASAVLLVRGLQMVGLEVRVPGLRRRADVAGVGEIPITARRYNAKERATKDAYIGAAPTVVIAEIKASRADLLRDIGDHAELLGKLGGLHLRRNELEAAIRRDEPNLRHRASLLAEEDSWRYDQSANAAYHKLLKEIARVRS
ncbi:MAG TPA: hypothetical protein VL860_14595, partial [Planctomycetota bacterium]|nr:hypothetical protein [Planctomycetota bacterium]